MPSARRRAAAEDGQAAVELAGLLLLVTAVLGAAIAVADRAGAAANLAGGVRRQMARAICLVDGGSPACTADRSLCVIGARDTGIRAAVDILVLRTERGSLLLKERRSDGTVAVTLVDEHALGLGASAGAQTTAERDGRSTRAGVSAQAQVLARAGFGTTWTFDDEAAADRWAGDWRTLAARLAGWGTSRSVARGTPTSVTDQVTGDVELGAGAGADRVAGGGVTLRAADTWGRRTDRDGTSTLFLKRDNAFTATLSVVGVGAVEHDLASTHEEYAVKVGSDGRLLELITTTTGPFRASRDLPGVVQTAVGYLGAGGARRRYVMERHLSLTSERNRRLATGFVDRVVHPRPKLGRVVDVSKELATVIDAEAVTQVRAYDDDDRSWSQGGTVGEGVKLGAELERVDTRSHLVGAVARGPDGAWYRREECAEPVVRA